MAERRTIAALVGAVVVIVAVVVVLLSGGGDDTKATSAAKGSTLPGVQETEELLKGIPESDFALGDPKAPVTLLEFADLQCPFCKQHQLEVQPKLIKELVRTGEAQITFVPLAFLGPDSVAARNVWMNMADHQGAWQFANLFYLNQGQENSGYVTDDFLRNLVAANPRAQPGDENRKGNYMNTAVVKQYDELAAEVLGKREAGTPGFTVGPTGGSPASYTWIELDRSKPVAGQLIRAVRKERKKILAQPSSPPATTTPTG